MAGAGCLELAGVVDVCLCAAHCRDPLILGAGRVCVCVWWWLLRDALASAYRRDGLIGADDETTGGDRSTGRR